MSKIIKLKEEFLKEVATIEYNWWNNEKYTYEFVYNRLTNILNNSETLPVMYLLHNQDQLIGFYEITLEDNISNYPKYKPLLANLYIKEEYRRQGYGRLLIKDVIKKAKSLGYKKLYLHSKHQGLYEKFGFKYLEEVIGDDGKNKRMYYINL